MLVLEHYILAMELWVHVSRLPMLDLDRDQWKHFILNILFSLWEVMQPNFSLLLHVLHAPDHYCTYQNNPRLCFFLVNFSFSTYTPLSCACALVVFHSISLIVDHSYSLLCRWWCRKFIFFFPHTIIHSCHLISLIIIHSYSSSCRWWYRKFIFFFLHTIICMCHLISLIISLSGLASSMQNYQPWTHGVLHITNYHIFVSF